MAKRKKKKNTKPLWLQWFLDRREFLQFVVTTATALFVALKPTPPPVQVVPAPPPPVPVAQSIAIPHELVLRVRLAGDAQGEHRRDVVGRYPFECVSGEAPGMMEERNMATMILGATRSSTVPLHCP